MALVKNSLWNHACIPCGLKHEILRPACSYARWIDYISVTRRVLGLWVFPPSWTVLQVGELPFDHYPPDPSSCKVFLSHWTLPWHEPSGKKLPHCLSISIPSALPWIPTLREQSLPRKWLFPWRLTHVVWLIYKVIFHIIVFSIIIIPTTYFCYWKCQLGHEMSQVCSTCDVYLLSLSFTICK